MTDDELIEYYARHIPLDPHPLQPLGRITWATTRLQHGVADALKPDLGQGLSEKPFDLTSGSAMAKLTSKARPAGELRCAQLSSWAPAHGEPVARARNGIMQAVPCTADDGHQASRLNRDHAAGLLELASMKLGEALDRCRKGDAS